MRTLLTVFTLISLAAVLPAAEETAPQAPTTAQLQSVQWWLRAAVEHAANIPPQPPPDKWSAPRDARRDALAQCLWLQVQVGDVAAARAAAQRYAPSLLGYVAQAQTYGDLPGALATVEQIPDAQEKQQALGSIADSLIGAAKFDDARRVLQQRPEDKLTPGLYEQLARAQAQAGDLAGSEASLQALGQLAAWDGFNDSRRAEALACLAAAQARAGNRPAYQESLAAAHQLALGLRPPYRDNALLKIARTQAEAGDYEAATATLNTTAPEKRAQSPDLVLSIQIRRGEVSPADALARVSPGYTIYEAVLAVQLAAKDHVAAVETLRKAREQRFDSFCDAFSEIPVQIVEGFLAHADVDGAASFVDSLSDPAAQAKLYGQIAAQRADAGDPVGYRNFCAKAIASALKVVDPRPYSAALRAHRSEVLGVLIELQAARDFEDAKKTNALIDDPKARRQYEVYLRGRELAAGDRLEEARQWMASLPTAEDRVGACSSVARQLMPALKTQWPGNYLAIRWKR